MISRRRWMGECVCGGGVLCGGFFFLGGGCFVLCNITLVWTDVKNKTLNWLNWTTSRWKVYWPLSVAFVTTSWRNMTACGDFIEQFQSLIQFPAVTICNLNLVRKSVWESAVFEQFRYDEQVLTPSSLSLSLYNIIHILGKKRVQ